MIRIATLDDLGAIVDIYNEAIEQRFATADLRPITMEQRVAWFREHDPSAYPIHVFEENGCVRGWSSLSPYRPGREALNGTAELSYYVAPDARRRGIGSALVQHAIDHAPRYGKRVLFAIVLDRNAPSIHLLERCGFELWGRLPDVAMIEGELVSHVYYGRRV
jgi:phosphinothricin acetyltransferase